MKLFHKVQRTWVYRPSLKMFLNLFNERDSYYYVATAIIYPHLYIVKHNLQQCTQQFKTLTFRSANKNTLYNYTILTVLVTPALLQLLLLVL